ncbi:hypothetical protein PY254_12025 [Rhodanobacter sp. AS-Z3]|uniref:hypothetical protein n=1 Tax=Rhodanobacter sp. AS-Z3 TaxID=3031330 RepID=UPI0024794EDE|nr:hypothetical protein [Rhodanobacter sp. AS-Z3]WEN13965.1 hypothetical protein PY254_12025 [Rhodanobacter sp. AS-Z3]
MFRAIAPQWLTNDLGVEVSSRDRNTMQYKDGDHVLLLYCDTIVDDDGRFGAAILLPHDAYWQPPFEQERIDSFVRARIEKNLLDAWGAVDYWVTIES